MMKNIKISLVLFALTSLLCVSCKDDFLNTVPKTTIPESEAYSTPGKILAQVNNLYGQLQNPSFYGGRFLVFNEQRSDEFGQNDGNAATGSAVWNQNVASTNEFINNVWSAGYTAINAANILIDQLNKTSVISDSLAQLYIGEAKYVRALCYLELCQTYAKPYNLDKSALGLPLRLIPVTSKGHNDLARSSVEEVYKQIILDLDDAEKALPVGYSSSLLNIARAHKSTAIALKTRVYLNQNNYAKVIEEAKKLVSDNPPFMYSGGSVTHNLEQNFASLWGGSYTGNEAIMSIPFANTSTETPPNQSALAYNYYVQPIIFLATGGIVANSALSAASDARSKFIATNKAKQKVLTKFAITTAPFRDYVPVIRYTEVILNYAEAAANIGDLGKALDLLKAVRNRSDASFVFQAIEVDTKDALVNTIVTERRIEFLGEGLRLQDLQRRLQNLPAKTGSIGTAPEVVVGAGNYIWPIPSGEISTNKLMLPN